MRSTTAADAYPSSSSCASEASADSDASSYTLAQRLAQYRHMQLVWAKCTGHPWYPGFVIDVD